MEIRLCLSGFLGHASLGFSAERPGHPVMEMVGWRVHDGRKLATIIPRCLTAPLHAFHNPDILGKYGAPHFGVGGAHVGEILADRGFICVVDFNLFVGSALAIGKQQDGKGMVIVNAKQHIREQGNIFRALVPLR